MRTSNTKLKIVQTLEDLGQEEFDTFRWHLCNFTSIPKCHLEKASRQKTVDRIVETYDQQAVELVKNILKKMKKNNLVEKL